MTAVLPCSKCLNNVQVQDGLVDHECFNKYRYLNTLNGMLFATTSNQTIIFDGAERPTSEDFIPINSWTDESEEVLIEVIRARRILWDCSMPIQERSTEMQTLIWNEVAEILQTTYGDNPTLFSPDALKKKWKALKDTMWQARAKMSKQTGSAGGTPKKLWKHFEKMSFLYDVVDANSTSSNLPEEGAKEAFIRGRKRGKKNDTPADRLTDAVIKHLDSSSGSGLLQEGNSTVTGFFAMIKPMLEKLPDDLLEDSIFDMTSIVRNNTQKFRERLENN